MASPEPEIIKRSATDIDVERPSNAIPATLPHGTWIDGLRGTVQNVTTDLRADVLLNEDNTQGLGVIGRLRIAVGIDKRRVRRRSIALFSPNQYVFDDSDLDSLVASSRGVQPPGSTRRGLRPFQLQHAGAGGAHVPAPGVAPVRRRHSSTTSRAFSARSEPRTTSAPGTPGREGIQFSTVGPGSRPRLMSQMSVSSIFGGAGDEKALRQARAHQLDRLEGSIDTESRLCMVRYHHDFIFVFGMNAVPDAVAFILAPLYFYVELGLQAEAIAITLAVGKVTGWFLGLLGELGNGKGYVLPRPHDTALLFSVMGLCAIVLPATGDRMPEAAAFPLVVLVAFGAVADGSTAETLHRLAFGLNRPSGESFTKGRNIFMFIAAVAALALPILYGWANRPHSMFYVAGCFMFAVVARLEWTYYRIKHTFDELRLAVEETALTQLPQMPGPDGSRRGSAMSTETGSLLSASGDIGQATSGVPRWSASAHSSTSTLASVSEMPYTNVNHTPKVTGRLTLLDGVTESPDLTDGAGVVAGMIGQSPMWTADRRSDTPGQGATLVAPTAVVDEQPSSTAPAGKLPGTNAHLDTGPRVDMMRHRMGIDGERAGMVSPGRMSLIGAMQHSQRNPTIAGVGMTDGLELDGICVDSMPDEMPQLNDAMSSDRLLRWMIVSGYPTLDNFIAVLLTVWMPVALHKQFNDDSDTATMMIACYALLGMAGQLIQSNPQCSPVETVNSGYDHVFHTVPVLAYFCALMVSVGGDDGGSGDYWFVPIMFAAFCETMGIQQKYLMVFYTGRPTYSVHRVAESVADSLRLQVKRSHMFNSLGGVVSFIVSSQVYESYDVNGALLLGLVATLCQLLIAIYIDQRLPWKGKRTDTDDNRMEMYEFRKTANNIDPTDVDAAEIVEGHAATANDGRRSLSQPVTPARQSGESRGSEPLSGTLAALARTPPVTSLGGAAAAADGADVASDEAGYIEVGAHNTTAADGTDGADGEGAVGGVDTPLRPAMGRKMSNRNFRLQSEV